MVVLKELFDEALKNNNNYFINKRKIVSSFESTGFYNLRRRSCPKCKQGFIWYYRLDDGRYISNVNFLKLKERVLLADLDWRIVDRNLALRTSKVLGLPLYDLI